MKTFENHFFFKKNKYLISFFGEISPVKNKLKKLLGGSGGSSSSFAAKQRTTLLLAVLGAGAQEELYDESHKQRKRPSLGQDKNTEDHHRSKQQ
jgi:hypothetical protein